MLDAIWGAISSPIETIQNTFTPTETSTVDTLNAAGSRGAPVEEAVGMTPEQAVVAGGGKAEEANTISTQDAFNRWGNVMDQFGKQLAAPTQQATAPAFKPRFQRPDTPAYGTDVMAQIGSMDYNI